MPSTPRVPNPDVDDFGSFPNSGGDEDIIERDNTNSSFDDIEQGSDGEDGIPLPPDVEERQPIEEPPRRDDAPVGDVDDSPKRIV